MADTQKHGNDKAHAAPVVDPANPLAILDSVKMPNFEANLTARYKKYFSKDARMAKPGTMGHILDGWLLGTMDMPKTQKDKDGNLLDWTAFCFLLEQPCPVVDPNDDSGDERKVVVAQPGEKIILTMSKALDREEYRAVANHPSRVFRFAIRPQVGRTKSSNQSVWLYPTFALVDSKGIPRDPQKHTVSLHGILDHLLTVDGAQLGSGVAAQA